MDLCCIQYKWTFVCFLTFFALEAFLSIADRFIFTLEVSTEPADTSLTLALDVVHPTTFHFLSDITSHRIRCCAAYRRQYNARVRFFSHFP